MIDLGRLTAMFRCRRGAEAAEATAWWRGLGDPSKRFKGKAGVFSAVNPMGRRPSSDKRTVYRHRLDK